MNPERDACFRKLFTEVFEDAQDGLEKQIGPEQYERRKFEFVFHMMDYVADMARFAAHVSQPEKWTTKDATINVIAYLLHVVPHLNAAGRLLLDHIADPFVDRPERKIAPNVGGD